MSKTQIKQPTDEWFALKKELTKEKDWLIDDRESLKELKEGQLNSLETIFTVGNGYACQRGNYEEGVPNQFLGHYIAGIFDHFDSMVNEMVNCPHWVPMKCYINGKLASFVDEMQGGNKEGGLMDQKWEILSHERILDMKKAALYRRTSFKDPSDGRITHLETLRFMSLTDPHTFVQRMAITPENYDDVDLIVSSEIDGNVSNLAETPYPEKQVKLKWEKFARNRHLDVLKSQFQDIELKESMSGKGKGQKKSKKRRVTYLEAQTIGYKNNRNNGARKLVGYASSLLYHETEVIGVTEKAAEVRTLGLQNPNSIGQNILITKKDTRGKAVVFDKLVTCFTSRDYFGLKTQESEDLEKQKLSDMDDFKKVSDWIKQNCLDTLENSMKKGFKIMLREHSMDWESKKWKYADFQFLGNDNFTKAMRFNIYHLLIAANENDHKASIGARTYSGEGYRGHVFWDTEIFTLPLFTFTQPETARSLLLFRYNTLQASRLNAQQEGYTGAKIAWEAADTGSEECPKWTMDLVERIWTGEEEIHISSDVVHGLMKYYEATLDEDFMVNYGLEIMLSIAKFWVSRCEWNGDTKKYDINKVIGPDEFHEHINNSSFTNYMARWVIRKAMEMYHHYQQVSKSNNLLKDKLEKLEQKLKMELKTEFDDWEHKADNMTCLFDEKTRIIEEFEGYFKLLDYEIGAYTPHGLPVFPEGIAEFWNETKKNPKLIHASKTMLVKQADIVMLFYLLGSEFPEEVKKHNFEFYEKRTMHKSSLSPSIYSIMGIDCDHKQHVLPYFKKSAFVDLDNNQNNNEQGFHAASGGGTWQVGIFGFGGLKPANTKKDSILSWKPWIPKKEELQTMAKTAAGASSIDAQKDFFSGVKYSFYWRGNVIRCEIGIDKATLLMESTTEKLQSAQPEKIKFLDKEYTLHPNKQIEIEIEI